MPAKRSLLSRPEESNTKISLGGLNLPTILLRLDKEGRLIWLSSGLFGRTVEELLGLKLAAVFKGTSKDTIEKALRPESSGQTQRLSIRNPETRQGVSLLIRPSSSANEDVAFFAAIQKVAESPVSSGNSTPKIEPLKVPARKLVLLADDEPALLNLTARILGMGGYSVLTAENGDECLSLFRDNSESVGLVILDFSMPGPEIPALLKAFAKGSEPPATVISTGHSSEVVNGSMNTELAWNLLQKPYSNTKLLKLAHSLLPLPDDD